MSQSDANPPLGGGALLSGLLFGLWIGVCDAWLKILARVGACESTPTVQDAAVQMWDVPASCTPLTIVPGVSLAPLAREGATALNIAIPSSALPVWGLALLAIATISGIVILRWSRRNRGDGLALGCLWGGLLVHALPRLAGPGTSFGELGIGGVSMSLADVAIVWAVLWLLWRMLAELRG